MGDTTRCRDPRRRARRADARAPAQAHEAGDVRARAREAQGAGAAGRVQGGRVDPRDRGPLLRRRLRPPRPPRRRPPLEARPALLLPGRRQPRHRAPRRVGAAGAASRDPVPDQDVPDRPRRCSRTSLPSGAARSASTFATAARCRTSSSAWATPTTGSPSARRARSRRQPPAGSLAPPAGPPS